MSKPPLEQGRIVALKMGAEKELATEIIDRVGSIIAQELGENWYKKTNLDDGKHIEHEDRKSIVIGMALRMTEKEILKMVNDRRVKANLPLLIPTNLYYYRKKYAEIIDQVYANIAFRIGETFRFADKIFRISRMSDLAEILYEKAVDGLRNNVGGPDDVTLKLTNLYLKASDKINQEMGGKSLVDHFKPHTKQDDEDEKLPDLLEKDDVSLILNEKYGAQLPKAITQKIEFTDFTNCAQGEKFGETYACFNGTMTKDDRGSMCPIQKGDIKICPKFINRSLVMNRDWLLKARERRLTIRDMIALAGCAEPDKDSFDRMVSFLKSQDVFKHRPQEGWLIEQTNDGNNGKSESVISQETSEAGKGTGETSL